MLTSVEQVMLVPGMATCAIPGNWLPTLVADADASIKRYCKRDLELRSYTQYYDGNSCPDITLRQWPVWVGNSTLDPSMGGLTLPQATITLTSTDGFPPGAPSGNQYTTARTATVQTGINTWTTFTYTGVSGNDLTGCSGGTGTLTNDYNRVCTPAVYYQAGSYGGQAPEAFGDDTLLTLGSQFMIPTDNADGTQGERGVLKRIGGAGAGWTGWYPEIMYSGKLAGYRQPFWPRGTGNVKVCYTAGYYPIPVDLQQAATMFVALTARTLPSGANLSSESLGGYSYSVLMNPDNPDMGDIRRRLAPFREVSW